MAGLTIFLALALMSQVRLGLAQTYDTFLEPNQIVDISSPFRDRLARLHVKEGVQVKAGQLLAELDTQVLKVKLSAAEGAAAIHGRIDSAKASVAMQTNRAKMLQELEKSGNARPQEMLSAQTDLAMATAQLQAAVDEQQMKKFEARVIEAQIEEKRLRSPINGVVVKINKQEAELIGESDQQPLMTVVQLDPLQALFHLPPSDAAQLKAVHKVNLTSGAATVSGEVHYIAPVINAQSGTVVVRVQVANKDNLLISGSRCNLILNSSSGEVPNEKRTK